MATPGRKLPEQERQRIIAAGNRGVAISEIARREMVSRPTVRKILKNKR